MRNIFFLINAVSIVFIFNICCETYDGHTVSLKSLIKSIFFVVVYILSEIAIGFVLFWTNYSESGGDGVLTALDVLKLSTMFIPSVVVLISFIQYRRKI